MNASPKCDGPIFDPQTHNAEQLGAWQHSPSSFVRKAVKFARSVGAWGVIVPLLELRKMWKVQKYDGYRKWTIEIAGVPLELLFQFAMLYKNYQWVYHISSMWRQVWYNFLASLTSSAFLSRTWLQELWDVPLALYPLGQSHGSNHFIWIGFSMKLTIQLLGYPHDYGNLHFCFRKCQHDQRMSSRARALASVFFVFRPDLASFQGHYLGLETGQGWCCTTKTPVINPYNIYSMYIHIYIYLSLTDKWSSFCSRLRF